MSADATPKAPEKPTWDTPPDGLYWWREGGRNWSLIKFWRDGLLCKSFDWPYPAPVRAVKRDCPDAVFERIGEPKS